MVMKEIDVHQFITTIYNPSLNEFMVPISNDLVMGHIIYEGRTIYRKDLTNLTSEGIFLTLFRDDLFHLGNSAPNFTVDSDTFLSALRPLYQFYLKNRRSQLSQKLEHVFKSTDILLESNYFSKEMLLNNVEQKETDFNPKHYNQFLRDEGTVKNIKSYNRFDQEKYDNTLRKERSTPYVKGVFVVSLLILGIYFISTSSAISDISTFIQNSSASITLSLTDVIETVSKALTPRPVNTNDVEKLILKYTNEERRKYGLKDLVWDDQLALIAREHSEDMAKNNFFSHTNLKGEDPTARAQRHGYPTRKPLGGGVYAVGIGENISKMPTGNVEGYGYVSNDADSVAKATVRSWMESLGHRDNILNTSYDKIGVGVGYDGTYFFATQDFF